MGVGVVELVILAMIGIFLVACVGAALVVLAMAATGRMSGPKQCPHCGADLRSPVGHPSKTI